MDSMIVSAARGAQPHVAIVAAEPSIDFGPELVRRSVRVHIDPRNVITTARTYHEALTLCAEPVIPKPKAAPVFALASMFALSVGVPRMPGERDPFRRPQRAPKPPADIQAATMAKAEERRASKAAKRLAAKAAGGSR